MGLGRTAADFSEALSEVLHEGGEMVQCGLVKRELPLAAPRRRSDHEGVVLNALLVRAGAASGKHLGSIARVK